MDESQIPDVVLSVMVDNHELALPQFFVVWDLVVVGLTFTNLVDGSVSVEFDLHVLKLFGVD